MRNVAIRKNTLPYIHPYSIIDIDTNEILGEFRTYKDAMNSLYELKNKSKYSTNTKNKNENETTYDKYNKRLKNPLGDVTNEKKDQ